MYLINKAVTQSDPELVVPTYQMVWVGGGVVSGGVFFKEFHNTTTIQVCFVHFHLIYDIYFFWGGVIE